MAEQQTEQAKKKKSPLLWIVLGGCGCLLILGCICSVLGYMMLKDETFQREFKKSYCASLREEELDPSEDPFGICD